MSNSGKTVSTSGESKHPKVKPVLGNVHTSGESKHPKVKPVLGYQSPKQSNLPIADTKQKQ